jgi:hypothetical protein
VLSTIIVSPVTIVVTDPFVDETGIHEPAGGEMTYAFKTLG